MHELSITESILEIALRHSGEQRITDLRLVIGELSTLVDESVQFYWDIVSEGTPAAGATLHFRRVPAQLTCQTCGHSYSCLLYTSDAADERSSVDLGGRRIIKKKKKTNEE